MNLTEIRAGALPNILCVDERREDMIELPQGMPYPVSKRDTFTRSRSAAACPRAAAAEPAASIDMVLGLRPHGIEGIHRHVEERGFELAGIDCHKPGTAD